MDQSIIKCFKTYYHTLYIECTIDQYNSSVTPSEIYDINQLKAMQLAKTAWNEIDTITIRYCWYKAGIFSDINQPAAQSLILFTALLNADSN